MDADALRVAAAWAAFAVFHSLTVSSAFERGAKRLLGERAFEAYHRLAFTAYSAAALLLVLGYVISLPDPPLYRLDGFPRLAFRAAQAAALAFLLWTPLDLLEFVGLRAWLRSRGRTPVVPARPARLYTGRSYAVVRHPLYLGCSALLAFQPEQSRNSLLSAALVVLYFYVGTFFEERRMERVFGEAYRAYRQRVPRFLPFRFPGGRRT